MRRLLFVLCSVGLLWAASPVFACGGSSQCIIKTYKCASCPDCVCGSCGDCDPAKICTRSDDCAVLQRVCPRGYREHKVIDPYGEWIKCKARGCKATVQAR